MPSMSKAGASQMTSVVDELQKMRQLGAEAERTRGGVGYPNL